MMAGLRPMAQQAIIKRSSLGGTSSRIARLGWKGQGGMARPSVKIIAYAWDKRCVDRLLNYAMLRVWPRGIRLSRPNPTIAPWWKVIEEGVGPKCPALCQAGSRYE
jgi:hypothetical protein